MNKRLQQAVGVLGLATLGLCSFSKRLLDVAKPRMEHSSSAAFPDSPHSTQQDYCRLREALDTSEENFKRIVNPILGQDFKHFDASWKKNFSERRVSDFVTFVRLAEFENREGISKSPHVANAMLELSKLSLLPKASKITERVRVSSRDFDWLDFPKKLKQAYCQTFRDHIRNLSNSQNRQEYIASLLKKEKAKKEILDQVSSLIAFQEKDFLEQLEEAQKKAKKSN